MGDISLNTRYLQSNRGIIKIIQILAGFVICSLLCGTWWGGSSCFSDGRLGYCSGLNFVVVVINIVLFILNFLNLTFHKPERLYSIVCTILFAIAAGIMIWFIVTHDTNAKFIVATALMVGEFVLFLWDVKILQGEASN